MQDRINKTTSATLTGSTLDIDIVYGHIPTRTHSIPALVHRENDQIIVHWSIQGDALMEPPIPLAVGHSPQHGLGSQVAISYNELEGRHVIPVHVVCITQTELM